MGFSSYLTVVNDDGSKILINLYNLVELDDFYRELEQFIPYMDSIEEDDE